MPPDLTIKTVAALPQTRDPNNVGRKISDFLPRAGTQPTKVTESKEGGGNVPYRTYWYSDSMSTTQVSYELDQQGQQAAQPFNVDINGSGKDVTYWATRGDGVIDWQQVSDSPGHQGSWFENLLDENRDGKADVLVQGYLGVGGNRFEQK